jgi:hypothetical protein
MTSQRSRKFLGDPILKQNLILLISISELAAIRLEIFIQRHSIQLARVLQGEPATPLAGAEDRLYEKTMPNEGQI